MTSYILHKVHISFPRYQKYELQNKVVNFIVYFDLMDLVNSIINVDPLANKDKLYGSTLTAP